MRPGWERWPLLAGATLCIAAAVALLEGSAGREFAAIVLIVVGSVLLGAFIADSTGRRD